MAQKRTIPGKRRTREHVLAELAVNHVERQVLLCGWSVEEIRRDYGIDLLLFTDTSSGELETGLVFVQVKGTEHLAARQSSPDFSFRIARADLVGWLRQYLPVILVVYEASSDQSYWIHIQEYFSAIEGFDLFRAGKTISVSIPFSNSLNPAAIQRFAALRDATLNQGV